MSTVHENRDDGTEADVCLLLEGTYPYVRGGVSSWVRQIIEGMPELRFSIAFLGARAADYPEMRYALPDNVVALRHLFLLDGPGSAGTDQGPRRAPFFQRRGARRRERRRALDADERLRLSEELHARLAGAGGELDAAVAGGFAALLGGEMPLLERDLFDGDRAWEAIRARYLENAPEVDFNRYFWSVRSMHAPLFALAAFARELPPARLYHAVSTGYAGFLGALLARERHRPYLLTEHGIYTKERELDIAQARWIADDIDPFTVDRAHHESYLRDLWIRFFRSLGRMSYASAQSIFSLYEGNRERQVADGAPRARTAVVPNGVDVARLARRRRAPDVPPPPVLALIGRVVPIKDIKTFVRAVGIVCERIDAAEGWIVGPEDEDPAYAAECRELVAALGLGERVRFLGFRDPGEVFADAGLVVLSSISEGQPLVVLEGAAAGLPAVTTDVGSCGELIDGVDAGDRALGRAGRVVPIANPSALAAAAVELLGDPERWAAASRAAIARVESRYDQRTMIGRYRAAYDAALDGATTDAPAAEGTLADGTTSGRRAA